MNTMKFILGAAATGILMLGVSTSAATQTFSTRYGHVTCSYETARTSGTGSPMLMCQSALDGFAAAIYGNGRRFTARYAGDPPLAQRRLRNGQMRFIGPFSCQAHFETMHCAIRKGGRGFVLSSDSFEWLW